MRVRITAGVLPGAFLFVDATRVEDPDTLFEFEPGRDGSLEQVSLSMRVGSGMVSTTFREEGAEGLVMRLRDDAGAYAVLSAKLRSLEAHLGFSGQGAFRGFDWDSVVTEYIPEGPEDEVQVSRFGKTATKSVTVGNLSVDALKMVAGATRTHHATELIKEFWREGANEQSQGRFIQAFYNGYFVLEALFAPGLSSPKRVLESFRKSKALLEVVSSLTPPALSGPHSKRLREILAEQDLPQSPEGMLEMLVRLRGQLHHVAPRSRKLAPSPRNQESFEAPASFVMAVAMYIVGLEDNEIAGTPLSVTREVTLREPTYQGTPASPEVGKFTWGENLYDGAWISEAAQRIKVTDPGSYQREGIHWWDGKNLTITAKNARVVYELQPDGMGKYDGYLVEKSW